MSVSIQQLFSEHFERFTSTHRLSKDMWHAANRIRACRTSALGGHVVRCPDGHQRHIAYNSCRHRFCSQCALLPREKWLANWNSRLLDCPHYHVIFTVPHELNAFWRHNKKLLGDSLFSAATGALIELLGDPKYLGAKPGLLAALHTWSQSLAAHVHLHVLVTGGGLSQDGRWRQVIKSCLLPRKVLMIVFRGKLRAELLAALDQGRLQLPPNYSTTQTRSLLNRLGRTVWNVKILDRYDHGVGVATYLARYLKGGPISPKRLLSVTDERIRFRCRQSNPEAVHGEVNLTIDQFFSRLLQHVPPRTMRAVRGYGLYAGCKRSDLNTARECLGQIRIEKDSTLSPKWQDLCRRIGRKDAAVCKTCGKELVVDHPFQLGRSPPSDSVMKAIN